MSRLAIPILALALGVGTAVALVSCGGDEEGLLPGDDAEQIRSNLDEIEQDVVNGDCDAAETKAEGVRQQIDDLGADVDNQLKDNLAEGVDRLVSLIPTDCEVPTATIPVEPPEETTETTTTEETESTTTTTTEPTTTTVPTTPTAPTTDESGGVLPPSGDEDG